MDKRLIKVAQELNVSTETKGNNTIFRDKGIHVLNKPTSKINEHTYQLLLKELRMYMVEKMKADSMTVGGGISWEK